jgi:hypothetical protein
MFRKFLPGLAPVLAMAALGAIPVVAQAIVPRWVINGVSATNKHEQGFSMGHVTLHNGILENLRCGWFTGDSFWNEVKEGTERGFEETTGYVTWECESTTPLKVKNSRGEEQEGVFLTAEEPPEAKTEKAHKAGSTSLPWTGELTEKEAGKFFVLTHHLKVWWVIPLCTEMGGTGKGPGCLLEGNEIPFEEGEGATEKAAGDEVAFRCVNGVKNGLSPSRLAAEGEKTEKNGKPETGRLESEFGAGYITGSLVHAGSTAFQSIICK